jgi:hypothetical protein
VQEAMSSEEKNIVTMACLGRPFRLGMLYDCRSDQLIPGMTLWNEETLINCLSTTPQIGSDCEIIAEDDMQTKASQLDISGGLKLSFLGGLFDVSGSAKYLKDHKSSKHQSRVSLKFCSTSRFDQLTMNQLGNIQHPHVISRKMATHVVVGVLYGADAIFVLDRMVDVKENENMIQVEVEALVKRFLPSLSGQVGLKFSGKEKDIASKLECKFHGDLQLPRNPTTFKEALQVFKQLPELLKGDKGPVAVPKKVWLHPLSEMNSAAAKIVCDISVKLVSLAEKVMEDFLDYEMLCSDLLKLSCCSHFTGLKTQISTFKRLISQYKMDFFENLSSLLPSIREGRMEESQLANMFKSMAASPFNSYSLMEWLEIKQKEVKLLANYFEVLEDIFVDNLSVCVGHLQFPTIVCFSFQFVNRSDAKLQQMQAYIRGTSIEVNETDSWSNNQIKCIQLKLAVSKFISFAKANQNRDGVKFVAADLSHERTDGATAILLFKNADMKVLLNLPDTPGNIESYDVTQNTISLRWSRPVSDFGNVKYYSVRYGCRCSNCSIDQCKSKNTIENETNMIVEGLEPATSYCFQVYAEFETGLCVSSEVSSPITTRSPNRLADIMKGKCTLISEESELPVLYQINTKDLLCLPGKMFSKVSIGEELPGTPEKVLMIVGATGSGKTTLINGMVNYILGVQWKDRFRFKLIIEKEVRSQAHSQTRAITAYTIYYTDGSRVKYNLTIIDTPGFGDTSGLKRDKEITEQIKELFSVTGGNGISHLNGIGFVIQSALARLTPTQQYIFDSILSIFGKDVANNIFIMVTFSDGERPQVLSAIDEAKIPHSGYFKFNNSAVFANNNEGDEVDICEAFWKIGVSSFKKCLSAFEKAESVSLTLTREVLQERERLEAIIQGLQQQMQACLHEIDILHQEKNVLKEHETDIERNKDFTYEIKVMHHVIEKLPPGTFVTHCMYCSFTCHENCKISNDDEKMGCVAMKSHGSDAKCTVCPMQCHWSSHKNTGEIYKKEYKMELKTYEDLKSKFEIALEGKAAVKQMLVSHQHKLEVAHAHFNEMINEAQQCLVRLAEIALKPNPLTQFDYIEILIMSEKRQAKEGWKERAKYLETAKEQAELLAITKDANDIDKQIEEEKEAKKTGWERRVETLKQVKRIKSEVEKIKEQKVSGTHRVLKGAINATKQVMKVPMTALRARKSIKPESYNT